MKIISVIIVTVFLTSCLQNTASDRLTTIKSLPAFEIVALDSTTRINTEELPSGTTSIFIYFSSNCDHCQQQMETILKYSAALKKTMIYMITSESLEEARKFSETYSLDTMPNIFVGRDYNSSFTKTFLPPSTPFLAIYDQTRQLKRIYYGATTINSIINTIND